MSYRLELELIGLPKRINQMAGHSWHSKYSESIKWQKRFAGKMVLTRQYPPVSPLRRAIVTITRYSSRAPDFDGLVSSNKVILDILKKSLIIEDDSMAHIGKPNYEWVKCAPRDGKINIIVEEVLR